MNQTIGATAIRPKERHGFEAISYFLHNPETGEFLGRTPKSWFLITVFYIIYYIFLAGFWAACILVFFTTIDDKVPRWTQDGSLIGRSGALGIRPQQSDELIDSSMVTFSTAKNPKALAGWEEWAERTRAFLATYDNQTDAVDCTNGADKLSPGQYCKFDVAQHLGETCGNIKGNFGYDTAQPCFYLKLNKIYGNVPDFYNDVEDLPDNFPPRVKTIMEGLSDKDRVWVDCTGENPADTESMGEIEYFPAESGFESVYFPFLNQENYRNPLVAVQFRNPVAGQLLHIECRAWAASIGYDRRDKIGRIHFELLIHNEATSKAVNKAM